MKNKEPALTAEQYNTLYCKAFAKLDEICTSAEKAMKELEELQLFIGEAKTGK